MGLSLENHPLRRAFAGKIKYFFVTDSVPK
jgi:hypothetical protein